jgi:WD40 repeat protein
MFPTMDRRPAGFAGRLSAPTISVLLIVSMSGCTGASGDRPDVIDQQPVESVAAPVETLSVAPGQVWGDGRGLAAQQLPAGGLAVVTTTGVFVVPSNGEPIELDRFDSLVQMGPTALSHDATALAVAISSPPAIRLYDLLGRGRVASYDLSPEAAVTSLEFDPLSGRFIADTTVGPFASPNLVSTAPEPLVEQPTFAVSAILPGGTVVTPIPGSAEVQVSTIDSSERRQLALGDGETVLDARVSPNGAILAVSIGREIDGFERSDHILLLDPATFEQRADIDVRLPLDPTQWAITDGSVVVADGPSLSFWGFDGAAIAGPISTDSPISSMRGVSGGLVSAHTDGALLRWTATGTEPAIIRPGGVSLQDIAVSRDGGSLTTVDYFGMVTVLDAIDGTQLHSEDRFARGETTGIAISIDGTEVGLSATSGEVSVLDDALAEKWTFMASETPELVGAVSFDPASGAVATGLAARVSESAFDDTVTVWDDEQQSPRFSVGGEKEAIVGCSSFYSRIRYSNDATMMAVTSHDFSVLVLDVATGSVQRGLPGTTTVLDLAFTPDDDLLVATYDDGTVNVWQTSDFSLAATYKAAPGGFLAIAVMPDSATVAVTDVTGSISLVDLMTGAPLRAFADATYRTSTLALTPDGALVAAPTADAGIGIWSTATGARVATLAGHTGPVTGLAFAPSGDWLASSSTDGTARTWTLERVS